MRENYKFKTPSQKIEIELELETLEKLKLMSESTKFTNSELVNTALKRFIATHKDFLPVQPLPTKNSN
jgi:predicted DNA-binding protein